MLLVSQCFSSCLTGIGTCLFLMASIVATENLFSRVSQHLQICWLPVCSSVDFRFLGQQICHSQIVHFLSFSVPALHVCLFICLFFFWSVISFFVFFFWRDLDEVQYPTTPTRRKAEGRNPIYVSLEREGAIRTVSYLGKIEGSDSHGEGLCKILYQAYHMLKKIKSVNMLTCWHFQICRVFPPE